MSNESRSSRKARPRFTINAMQPIPPNALATPTDSAPAAAYSVLAEYCPFVAPPQLLPHRWRLAAVTHSVLHSGMREPVKWRVFYRRKVEKNVQRMPLREQQIFANLVEDLMAKGPIRSEWRNFSKLGPNEYHCHLSYSWVACWRVTAQTVEIEVYYAGSREDAPY